jgi:hypothetical protein
LQEVSIQLYGRSIAKGEWKFLVDLGVTNTPPGLTTDVKKIDVAKRSSARQQNMIHL